MTEKDVWIAAAVIALVTALIRFFPFVAFGRGKVPKIIEKLGGLLPYSVMGMLVVYCLKDLSFTKGAVGFVPEIISVFIVTLLYAWRRNTLISIIAGTVSYMLLVQLVFTA